ncbi:early nodulin-55-2 [Quercus robur]|uniref:early nodulin-55-2 n=1 Tax=Quercus robur TaxID=38942 RepID=UPI0021620A53|nr:early nodulin-55-2 [Quercus robur]
MKVPSMLIIFFLSLFALILQPSHSTTILVDGVSEWKNPAVHIGDSIIFKRNHYNLYIFKNQRAFNLCNFTQATLLSKLNSTSYTWHPSRPGFFYFTFNNGTLKTCEASEKYAVKVTQSSTNLGPSPAPAPAPSSGRVVSSSPAFSWPFHPRQADSPSPAPSGSSSSIVPDKGGGIPFINSNPAVPLPTGEVDSATIRPIPTSAHEGRQVMVGPFAVEMALLCVALLML